MKNFARCSIVRNMISSSKVVTLASVARRAAVSINTAAKVLAGQAKAARISEETAKRIRAIADELGYVPNQLARSLRSKRTGLIGVFIADMTDPVYADITHSILNELPNHDLLPVITVAEAGLEQCIQAWLRNRVEAILLCGTIREMDDVFFKSLLDIRIPIIIAGNAFRRAGSRTPGPISTVHVDNEAGIKMAIDHLRAAKRKDIAYISGPSWHSDDYQRQTAYRSLVLGFQKPCVIAIKHQTEHWQIGYSAAAKVLEQAPRCDAILAYDDLVALGAMKCLADNGVAVPGELAVAGFDDLPNSQYSTPSLTSVRQPTQEIGLKTVNLLGKLLTGSAAEHIKIRPTLSIRQSTS